MAQEQGQIREEELDAQREAVRRTALSQIRQYGDPALRLKAREVEDFDDDLDRLVRRLKQLMVDANGIGLAATQLGVLRRVLVFQVDREQEPVALVNPVVVERSEQTSSEDEGCLSLQGVLVPVERPTAIAVEGKDETGADVRLELDEPGARVVQHEVDHLDGVLIVDRTTPEAQREALSVLRPRIALV
ncbi:MAG: peptide deformylase [Thermoleophilia bacterium]|nr:peptide deformylase [Thermoleophilia bacterium]